MKVTGRGTRFAAGAAIVVGVFGSGALVAQDAQRDDVAMSLRCFEPGRRAEQKRIEGQLMSIPNAASLRAMHELIGEEPHVAGTPGDWRAIEALEKKFAAMGLEVLRHDIWVYLPQPVDAALEIIESETAEANTGEGEQRRGVLALRLKEDNLLEDPYDTHPDLDYGWNAYSGSGDVTAEVVYANQGTKADFERLRELGVDVSGKIVLARYGGNFRGYKAKFAEEAGATGLVIYTDPVDSGYAQGLTYPEGGWANDTCIQRGSVLTLPYVGDPLTPFVGAAEDAERLDPAAVKLPTIPVQPIGWAAAREIMSRMRGAAVADRRWQGGLPLTYRLTGGPELRVRLMVKQERRVVKTANVLGILRGSAEPERTIILGCHHDAWGFGAGDPLAGLMVLLESARSFGELAKGGWEPARTLVFAAWGAEEFGIIGSTEYAEQFREELSKNAVAYINLDMAAMGPNFGSSASPLLKQLIADAVRDVPQARRAVESTQTVFEAWQGGAPRSSDAALVGDELSRFGSLGGGSDHVGFYCHLGIASAALSAGGSPGVSYHSNYDNLAWYRKVVGEDYEPALMLARVVNVFAARLASADVLPLDPSRYGVDVQRHLDSVAARAKGLGFEIDVQAVAAKFESFGQRAAIAQRDVERLVVKGERERGGLETINGVLVAMERAWLSEEGLPERNWFRSLFAAPDPDSGYAEWMLPELRWAVEQRDAPAASKALTNLEAVHARLVALLERIEAVADRELRPVDPQGRLGGRP